MARDSPLARIGLAHCNSNDFDVEDGRPRNFKRNPHTVSVDAR